MLHELKCCKPVIISGLLVTLVILAIPSTAFPTDDNQWIRTQFDRGLVPGMAVTIVSPGQAQALHVFGFCDIDRQLPCTGSSQFQLGSVTKFFTGLLSATLVDEQRLSLDEPIVTHWPDFRLIDDRGSQITMRDLLTQRSGIGSIDWPYFWDSSQTQQDYLDRVPYFPMAQPFRKSWNYANANFVIAGAYLERVTGITWETLIRHRLLEPLQMQDSGFNVASLTTIGYGRAGDGTLIPITAAQSPAINPAGGLNSSISDFAHFLEMVLDQGRWQGRRILPEAAIASATDQIVLDLSPDKRTYGMGIYALKQREITILHHTGSTGGYSAYFALIPERKTGVAVFVNLTNSTFPEGLALALIARMNGGNGEKVLDSWVGAGVSADNGPVSEPWVVLPRSPESYSGTYHHPAWGTFMVRNIGNRLVIRYGSLETVLDPSGHDNFSFLAALNWERIRVRFDTDDYGRIRGFILKDDDNDQEQYFTRI